MTTKKHASEYTPEEWAALNRRIAAGLPIDPGTPAPQPLRHVRDMTDAQVNQAINKIHMKGR